MKITITKTVKITSEVKLENLKVVKTKSRDVESTNLEIYYNDQEIGYGHMNNVLTGYSCDDYHVTNLAHVTINKGLLIKEDECDLIDYLVDGIENRTIHIN